MESLHESRLDETDAVDGRRSTGRKKLMHTPYLVFPVNQKGNLKKKTKESVETFSITYRNPYR